MPKAAPSLVRLGPLLLLFLASGSCSNDQLLTPRNPQSLITVSPQSVELTFLGETEQLTATVLDGEGDPVSGASVTWSSANASVASVSGSGVVTATGAGSTRVTATSSGVSATVAITVTQVVASVTIEPDSAEAPVGGLVSFSVRVEDAGGAEVAGATVEWSSTDPDVAGVDGSGTVSALSVGRVGIVATSGSFADTAWLDVIEPEIISEVDLSPASLLLEVGSSATLEVLTLNEDGAEVPPPPGVWSSSEPEVATVDADGLVSGVAQGRTWIRLGYEEASDSTLFTVVPDLVTEAGAYDIGVRILGVEDPATVPLPEHIAGIKAAERRWQPLITGDLAFATPTVSAGGCGVDHPAFSEQIDDLILFVEVGPIDGVGNILSEITQCVVRTSNGLPVLAGLHLDVADLADLHASGDLGDALIREMGHALGFGTSGPWKLLLVGEGTSDPHFPGANAVEEFEATGLQAGNVVPVENDSSSDARRDRRWREAVMGREVMTGFLDSGVENPLSRVTLAAMVDLGYEVELDGADAYPGGSDVSSPARKLHLEAIFTGPLWRIDDAGRQTRGPGH